MAIAWSMDKLGPMARTADDCGRILSVIAGHDPRDHDSLFHAEPHFRYPAPELEPGKPLRIGVLTNIWNRIDPEVQKSFEEGVEVLKKAGARVSEVAMPDGPFEEAAELTILMEAASAFQNLIRSGDCAKLVDPLGQINGYASETFSSSDYLQVQRVRAFLQQRVDKLFDSFDVLTAAGQSNVAQPLPKNPPETPPNTQRQRRNQEGQRQRATSSAAPDGVSSLCGLPALAVPCGLNSKGLPIAIQFLGRGGADHSVIAAAKLFQGHTQWHKKHPDTSAMLNA